VSADPIITGEAVALDLRLARAGSRGLAYAIDALVITIALVFALIAIARTLLQHVVNTGDVALVSAVLLVTIVGIVIGYPVTFETLSRGRSLGKLALGLRVVRDDGGPIRFRQAFIRGLVGFFELYAFSGVPAVIVSLASRQGKRIGDYLAGTVVLQERVPAKQSLVPPMPPQLAAWAESVDLTQVNNNLALAARQFLARADQLHPAARWDMEVRLATAVAAVISPQPPPGTPPWAVLAAVLAERRRRDEHRLQTSAALTFVDQPSMPEPTFPLSTAPPSTAPPSTAAPSTAAPSTAPPSTAPPSTAPPSTAPPSTAPPSTAPPSTADLPESRPTVGPGGFAPPS
jgi:uncharacterized RDD family membrane protein YckC